MRNYSSNNNNWRSTKNLSQWLIEKNIIGLYGIDTRALVKILRINGSMNGLLTSEDIKIENCLKIISGTPKMEGLNLSKEVTTKKDYLWEKNLEIEFDFGTKKITNTNNKKKLRIVAIDFGIKSF